MDKVIRCLVLLIVCFCLNSCKKNEEYIPILQDKYEPSVNEAEFKGEDFIVNLNARTLQPGERGEWRIISGTVVADYVYFDDKANPFSKFKGIPGEEYLLEWKHWSVDKKETVLQTKVKIPDLNIEIKDDTPLKFETIRTLSVNPKFRGTWSFDRSYARLESRYFDGYAEPPEKKPSVELHGYASTSYTATFSYSYAGKLYQFKKVIKTGNYTQEEGLSELQMSRGTTSVIEDKLGNILELNMQASAIAWILGEPNSYPALQAFKKLRKLILGGSSLDKISTLFGDYYLELEELNLDGIGENLTFPANFGNLTKLKTLTVSPRFSANPLATVVLPKSFANLKALESFTTSSMGLIDFNGTLGGLTSLKTLRTPVSSLPDNIGDLKALEFIELLIYNTNFPSRFSECSSLKFARINFFESATGTVTLSPKIGDLKNLEQFEITSNKLRELPASFSDLSALKILRLSTTNLQSIPSNFGNLVSLEDLSLYGAFSEIPESIGGLKKLIYLHVGGKAQELPESFGDLSSLEYFDGSSSEFRLLPNSIGKLKNLKEISLGRSKIEVLPSSFSQLDALEKLDLSTTKLKAFPAEVIPLKNIKQIYLSNTSTGDVPDAISTMKTGVYFGFQNISNLTQEHLQYILSISKGKTFSTSYGYYSN